MREPYWWYVIYVRSNTEHRAVEALACAYEKSALPYSVDPFCPESEQYFRGDKSRVAGKRYKRRPLFPCYIFVETDMPAAEFRKYFYCATNRSSDIIRLLCYGNTDEIALRADERRRLEYLLKGKRCLEHSEGYIVGDKITVTGGPLVGMEGCIKKINRHNRTAEIETELFNQKQTIKVALEIVSKTDG